MTFEKGMEGASCLPKRLAINERDYESCLLIADCGNEHEPESLDREQPTG